MAIPAGAVVADGIARTNDGKMYVILLGPTDAIPAGAVLADGIARSADGYVYVTLG